MRVVFFTPNYPGVSQDGGIGSYVQNLGAGLSRLGHGVVVLTPGFGPDVMDGAVCVRRVSTKHLPIADRFVPGAGACWRVARAMQKLVSENQVDLVEFPNWEGLGLAFQHLSRTPVIVRLHTSSRETQIIDGLPNTRMLQWDVRRERWQAQRANALVTHSAAHRDMMAAELEIAAEKIHLIPHGVPVYPEFRRPERGERPRTVVFLGRMEKRKGTVDLIQAMPKVLERVPETEFVLIGSDRPHCPGNRTHAQYLADEFSPEVAKQVKFLGRQPQSEVDRWLQTADVFVAPSLYESFGLVFPEAMRWGTPVIGTRVGGIPEIISDGETGLLVEPSQPKRLADAVVRLLSDEGLRRTLGEVGRRHVEANFAVERMARQTVELYESVLGAKGKKLVRAAS